MDRLERKRESIRNNLSPQAQNGFIQEEEQQRYTDFRNVESQRNDLTAEEFPEGPYGSGSLVESIGKSTPWREDQRSQNAYTYENRNLHEGIPRDHPGDFETPSENEDVDLNA
ncbi:hypothetical protein [Paenibacillus hamazuiensis]|uniref:hypothetical protein n=1 Tax=Paenibacillus hamazuiensis TaxID=2936508 RepID=UPI00200D8740|nr:hypothetical protein [Paenibacillus hamazuiensis]